MADTEEVVLFEESNVKVTTEWFILGGQRSCRLSELMSAEAGHWEPQTVQWVGMVGVAAFMLAGAGAVFILTQLPMGEGDTGRPLEPIPPEPGWKIAAGLGAVGAIAMTLYYILRQVVGREIVRVDTDSDEAKIIFRSRHRKLVRGVVEAINKAIAQQRSIDAMLHSDPRGIPNKAV